MLLFGGKRKVEKMEKSKAPEKINEEYINDEPRICLFDFSDNVIENLIKKHFNCTTATLGTKIKVPNLKKGDEHLCKPNHSFPINLHEYHIVIIDLKNTSQIPYHEFNIDNVNGKKAYALLSEFPERIFDPIPISAHILNDQLSPLMEKKFFLIVFSDAHHTVDYTLAEIGSRGYDIDSEVSYNNFSFYDIPVKENKSGKIVNICNNVNLFSQFLNKYKDQFTYDVIFSHPEIRENNTYVKNKDFVPLMKNADDEIISFVECKEKSILLVFPQIDDKAKFLSELLEKMLPEIIPELFPNNTQFMWVNHIDYQLPNENSLYEKKELITKEYNEKLLQVDKEIEQNKTEYQFLHDLLTQTDNLLVKTVENYFKWLGFENVINVDELQPELKEEDLRVELANGLLVVEIKGLGGTSTDSDCSQVSKFRYRRMMERNSVDVKALFILNHQRYLPPKERQNPPFTELQINDAKNDNRGLLTTYELFKLFFLIESGIITKEKARKTIEHVGLISFSPDNVISLGIPKELLKKRHVVIVNLSKQKIKKGDKILVCKNGQYTRSSILEIRVNDEIVEEVNDGEVGILLDTEVQRNSELLLITA